MHGPEAHVWNLSPSKNTASARPGRHAHADMGFPRLLLCNGGRFQTMLARWRGMHQEFQARRRTSAQRACDHFKSHVGWTSRPRDMHRGGRVEGGRNLGSTPPAKILPHINVAATLLILCISRWTRQRKPMAASPRVHAVVPDVISCESPPPCPHAQRSALPDSASADSLNTPACHQDGYTSHK